MKIFYIHFGAWDSKKIQWYNFDPVERLLRLSSVAVYGDALMFFKEIKPGEEIMAILQ